MPAARSLSIDSGTSATRRSPGAISLATPTFILISPAVRVMNGPEGEYVQQKLPGPWFCGQASRRERQGAPFGRQAPMCDAARLGDVERRGTRSKSSRAGQTLSRPQATAAPKTHPDGSAVRPVQLDPIARPGPHCPPERVCVGVAARVTRLQLGSIHIYPPFNPQSNRDTCVGNTAGMPLTIYSCDARSV